MTAPRSEKNPSTRSGGDPFLLGPGRAEPPKRWISPLVILVPFLISMGRALWRAWEAFAPAGDQAVLELGVRRALAGAQLLGPYSRFKWSHPGPAYFYLQSVPYGLTGGAPRSMVLGAVAVNLGCALATVLVVRRHTGELVARWAALLLAAYLVIIGPAVFTDPWNPYVITVPLLLTLVLAAAAAAGSAWSLVGAAGVGSYVVQTHVGAAVPVAAAVALGGVGWCWFRRGRERPVRHRRALAAGVGLMVLMWLPPSWQQATDHSGNLAQMLSFFQSPPANVPNRDGQSLPEAAAALADQVVVLPAGLDSLDHRAPHGARGALAVLACGTAALVARSGWRQRRVFAGALGLVSLTTAVAGVAAATRIVDVLEPYLIFWSSVLLLPAWIGLGMVVAGSRWGGVVLKKGPSIPGLMITVAGVAVGGVLSWSALRAPDVHPSATEVATAHEVARRWLAASDTRDVHLRWEPDMFWPVAAGLALQLERDGLEVSVERKWLFLFGDDFRGQGRRDAVIGLAATDPPPGAVDLGQAGKSRVWGHLMAAPPNGPRVTLPP